MAEDTSPPRISNVTMLAESRRRTERGDSGIDWVEGNLPAIVDRAEDALLDSREPIYQRGNQLVRVVHRDALTTRRFRRAAGAIGLVALDAPYMIDMFTRVTTWRRFDRRSQSWKSCNCPDRVATTYLSRIGEWRVRRLWAATDAPTLRADGSLLQQPGFDEASGILFDPGESTYPKIPDEPSRAQAEAALGQLAEIISTFPFAESVDRSVALALLLTALVRRSLPAAPLGAITAPTMASGKTLLADGIAILATGTSAPVMAHPATEEEANKVLLALLGEGEGVVVIDNVERPLEGAWLCAALTSESFSARRLGSNVMGHVPTSALWLATGNALVLVGDLRTRALLCRIDPRTEHPEQREFDGDLRETIAMRRPQLVAAGLTIMRAFIAARESPGDWVKPWGRFEAWSDRVRAPLVWLGIEDPCASLTQLERDDPERVRHAAMLRAWHIQFENRPATVREAIDSALQDAQFREAMEPVCRDRSGQLDPLRLGRWLRHVAGRIVAGAEFQRAGDRQGSALWQVEGRPNA